MDFSSIRRKLFEIKLYIENVIKGFIRTRTKLKPAPAQFIPKDIDADERILRGVYHPMNFHKTKNVIHLNVLRSPPGIDEVSVLRTDYMSIDRCRKFLRENDNSEKNRSYKGFCILIAQEITNTGSRIEADFKPIAQHANIKHGYISQPGESLPAYLRLRLEGLLTLINTKNRYFEDPEPQSEIWEGREIKILP